MKEIRICDDTELKRVLPLCKELNLGLEIQGFYNPELIENEKETAELIEKSKSSLKGFLNGLSMHAPFWDFNLGSKNSAIKNATMKAFNYAYKVAESLGVTEIIVHNGFVPNTSYYSGWVKNAVIFWQEFFKDKGDKITMMIENQCEEDSEVIKMEIDAVCDKRLKVCLDIGHAHANSNISVENWTKTLGERIGYVHIHNNHGKKLDRPSFLNDEHLGLDNGTIDIKNVLNLLEQYSPNAVWSVESKLEYLNSSIDVLKSLNYIKL